MRLEFHTTSIIHARNDCDVFLGPEGITNQAVN